MSKEDTIQFEGVVTDVLPESRFRVRLENGMQILAYGSGKMKMHRIKVLMGDKVTVEMSPYDLTKGRITFRHAVERVGGPGPNRPNYRR